MSDKADPITVAVFNTSADMTALLRAVLEHAGYVVVTAFTTDIRDSKLDLEGLMRQHRPQAVVYDIALPYDQNWRLMRHLQASPACEGVPFVLTTTNIRHLREIAGENAEILEIIGKPYDLEELIQAVGRATGGPGALPGGMVPPASR